ncbi:MAG: hypothetical protein BWY67_01888 [Bacteroidetes bacterium ADurb.Bin397]|nr:MAG: hypothetical protein BWY67_01888 [Bacteroidetes bacterium ADurb.Bin397]
MFDEPGFFTIIADWLDDEFPVRPVPLLIIECERSYTVIPSV